MRSAVGPGCQVIQIPDLIQPSEELLLLGHLVVESLDDVRELLQSFGKSIRVHAKQLWEEY
ncbi:MAG: hypothetical protein CM1200mP24_08110 [Gammaproteobacteria bacterium]|nr:MAG: hypothetical protein CM1200mP24_08110 [Gammaproteobacteria bacterium]